MDSALKRGQTERFRGNSYVVNLLPKIKLEIVISDHKEDDVVAAIEQSAYTGEVGDGKIFVSHVEHAVQIRTGEEDDAAL